ncbi:MAG: RDD family protein [Lysobacteraceae bacterium]
MNTVSESPKPQAATPAALGWRVLALIYDVLPLLGIWFAVAALMLALRLGQPVVPGGLSAFAEQVLLLLATFAYFGLSWRRGGQTLGMRAWRLRLLDAQGGAPSWRQILLRAVVAPFSLALFGLGFLWSLFERERRSWHDLASNTVIVRLPKPKK